ncbi:hypothetical protein F8M41_022658 [Gigaspora margarita]|uniref:Uncharacterized protein n=1 Tax=Gigaspora margarita TaxID=4874 RepID=A0A8H4EHS9_GIGMA|nr:hypothetical protein F8M41_022658 [Gigaspora margarita]
MDDILRSTLKEEPYISSFGGTYIDIFNGTIIVNTVDFSKVDELRALPQINPFINPLHFKPANNSLIQLKNNFDEIYSLSRIKFAKNLYILTDMEYNNIVLYFFDSHDNNTEFLNAVKPFNPIIFYLNGEDFTNYNNSKREIRKKLLGGDGLYNRASNYICSAGFWAMNRYEPEPLHGVHICKSGYTTHFTCGFVKGLNGIFIRKEYISTDLIVTDLYSEPGDSGGSVMSFVSPQDLNSMVLNGIHVAGGAGLSVALSIEIIFEVLKESDMRKLVDLVLYLGNS